jgi:hypothetical protein
VSCAKKAFLLVSSSRRIRWVRPEPVLAKDRALSSNLEDREVSWGGDFASHLDVQHCVPPLAGHIPRHTHTTHADTYTFNAMQMVGCSATYNAILLVQKQPMKNARAERRGGERRGAQDIASVLFALQPRARAVLGSGAQCRVVLLKPLHACALQPRWPHSCLCLSFLSVSS